MKTASLIVAAAVAVMGVSVVATGASAAVVCNAANECWHTKGAYHYRPAWGVTVHPNNWAWAPAEHYTWREHAGRGYWRDGRWVRF